jgi:Mor family transcriptional regulator
MAVISKPELSRLQKLLGKDEAIANRLRVTRQTIVKLRKKYGIQSMYARNEKRNKRILSLFNRGKTTHEIAKKFGLSVSRTYKLQSVRRTSSPIRWAVACTTVSLM